MTTSTERVVLFDEEAMRDPYPLFERLRAEGAVHRAVSSIGLNVWVITRYEEARAALADPRLSKNAEETRRLVKAHAVDGMPAREFATDLAHHMLQSDPPDHTRLRKLVTKAFTARRVESLRPRIEEIADELLDRLDGVTETNLIDSYAFELPITVICELLGVPLEDRADFREWSNTLLSNAAQEEIAVAGASMVRFFTALIAAKRADPADDLISALIEASEDADRLNEVELISMLFLLLVAGHETTVNLIGNGMLALLRNPDQLATLRADLSLLPGAIEEFLRFDGPVKLATFRYTAEPVEFDGVTIPAGELVLIALNSANRDSAKYPEPDRLDITRATGGHLAFGHGIHFCLGAPLARMEGEIAIRKLLERHPDLALVGTVDELEWRESGLLRSLTSLRVRL